MKPKKIKPEIISMGPFDYVIVDGVMTELSMWEAMNKPKRKQKKITKKDSPILDAECCYNCEFSEHETIIPKKYICTQRKKGDNVITPHTVCSMFRRI